MTTIYSRSVGKRTPVSKRLRDDRRWSSVSTNRRNNAKTRVKRYGPDAFGIHTSLQHSRCASPSDAFHCFVQLRAQETQKKLQADAEAKAAQASSLAKLIAEREDAVKAERVRRKVASEGQEGREDGKALAISTSAEPQADGTAAAKMLPSESVLSPPLPDSALSVVETQDRNVLSFEPPLEMGGGIRPATAAALISRFRISSVFAPDSKQLATKHLIYPLSPQLQQDSAWLASRIEITSQYFSTSRGRRKLAALERELQTLCGVHHPHLRPIYGFQLSRTVRHTSDQPVSLAQTASNQSGSQDGFMLSVISDVPDPSELRLGALLSLQPLATPQFLKVAQQLLSVTAALHSRNLLLRCLALDDISICREQTLMIDDIWAGALMELHHSDPLQERHLPSLWPGDWSVPELASEMRHSRKTDAFIIGRILLRCLGGPDIDGLSVPDSIQRLEDRLSTNADREALKLISNLLERSPRKRISPSEACHFADSLSHQQASDPLLHRADRLFSAVHRSSPAEDLKRNPLEVAAASPPNDRAPIANMSRSFFSAQPRQPVPAVASRFLADFVALSMLGKGAFGVVSKVRNRLDGGVYAVKKIRLGGGRSEAGGGEEKTLREIGALARV